MLLLVVKMLNYFPLKGGVSTNISPKTIISGETLDYKKYFSLPFGQYCQVHEEETPRNSQIVRTKGAISLVPSGHKFMALNTGGKINRRSWDVIPIPDIIIDCVKFLGTGQPEMLTYTNCHGRLIGDIEIPGVDADNDNNMDTASVFDDDIESPGVDAGEVKAPQQVEIYDLDIPGNPDPIQVETVEEEAVEYQAPAVQAPEDVQADPIPDGPRRSVRIRTSPKTYTPSMSGSKYSFAVEQLEWQGVLHPDAHMFVQEDIYQAEPNVVASVMTQLSMKAGLRAWETRLCQL